MSAVTHALAFVGHTYPLSAGRLAPSTCRRRPLDAPAHRYSPRLKTLIALAQHHHIPDPPEAQAMAHPTPPSNPSSICPHCQGTGYLPAATHPASTCAMLAPCRTQ